MTGSGIFAAGSNGDAGEAAAAAKPARTAPRQVPKSVLSFCLDTKNFLKNISRVFYLDVHFLFLLFDKFLYVKIFLVIFFISPICFLKFFSTHQFFT